MKLTEIKQLLKNKQNKDEAEAIQYLAVTDGAQSAAGRIYRTWELDRQLIKDCHVAIGRRRSLQVTFNNIVGATRFKTLDGGRLVRARRQMRGCGSADSWGHFLQC